ncbi:hypothetical protein O7632_29570 [Solwaraspora sp. WMMD406]|uniref:hypothetical protein n=1 Tax=Solwaraspora sp. WMMD406 TaxID=3016095 RepID=UPI002415CBB2|nr:hypothetical protein [Solwaraspora sp. WMMD406]MDG4768207.1 hypothetical protein [Solwaraspora sp. WMMD406]
MRRAVWLLDVDGVVNVTRPGWGAAPRNGTAHVGAVEYRLRWAPALIDRIRSMHRAGAVEIRWCSTWCVEADQVERLFGLPRLGRSWTHEMSTSTAAVAKLAAAREVVAQGQPLIWTDDAETPTSGPVHEELTASGRALLIAPLPNRGLQPEHLDQIEAFAASAAAGSDTEGADALRVARRLLGDQAG